MKKTLFFLMIVAGFSANAQSLKDMLYSGKLKLDSNTVVRKGDDLSKKIDTSTKKPVIAEAPKPVITPATEKTEAVATTENATTTTNTSIDNTVAVEPPVTGKEPVAPVKSNNKLWKEYTDSLAGVLKAEVLTSKKIKKETYYLTVEYEIGTDAQVNVINVISSPENEFLQEQVRTRMVNTPPNLAPVIDSTGKVRKVKRNYNFNITKE